MGLGYDDMVRYADASLAAHQQRVTELAERSSDGSWGDPAMRHRIRLESWRDAQRSGVHRWAISRGDGAVCTCGLITGDDPLRSGSWRRFFGWLGHLNAATDAPTARFVVSGGPYDHVLWCAFCGPVVPVRRTDDGSVDESDLDDLLERHSRLCPVP